MNEIPNLQFKSINILISIMIYGFSPKLSKAIISNDTLMG